MEIHPIMPGCVLLVTPSGPVQIGAPFDAFKRVARLAQVRGFDIPRVLVAPDASRLEGMALWAPEFYMLHHMFVYGSAWNPAKAHEKMTIATPTARMALAADSLRDSLLGPDWDELRTLKGPGNPKNPQSRRRWVPETEVVQLKRISDAMAAKRADGSVKPIADIVEFLPHDVGQALRINADLTLKRLGGDRYIARSGDQEWTISLDVEVSSPPLVPIRTPPIPIRRDTLGWISLGNRSGFSLIGPNTGFLFWINGQALLYDGPYGTLQYLDRLGVHPGEIGAWVCSHVHEDHIGSLCEMALLGHRPPLYTTEPIYQCVLRKLAGYLDQSIDQVAALLDYRRVRPGKPWRLWGAEMELFPTVHPIPTVGMRVSLAGRDGHPREIVLTGDTHNRAGLQAMRERNEVPESLYRRMMDIVPPTAQADTHYLVDAGRAMIHGIDTEWNDNPNRIFFYHVDTIDPSVPPNHTLAEFAKPATLQPSPEHPIAVARAMDAFFALLGLDNGAYGRLPAVHRPCEPGMPELGPLFSPAARWRAILTHQGALRRWAPGSRVICEGEAVNIQHDRFHLVVGGAARVSMAGRPVSVLQCGDFFGEMAILLRQRRNATIEAALPTPRKGGVPLVPDSLVGPFDDGALWTLDIPAVVLRDFVRELRLLPVFHKLWDHRPRLERIKWLKSVPAWVRHRLSVTGRPLDVEAGEPLWKPKTPHAIPGPWYLIEEGVVLLPTPSTTPALERRKRREPPPLRLSPESRSLFAHSEEAAVAETPVRVWRLSDEAVRLLEPAGLRTVRGDFPPARS